MMLKLGLFRVLALELMALGLSVDKSNEHSFDFVTKASSVAAP